MKRKLRNSLSVVIFAVLLLLISCGKKKQADVLPPNILEAILYDYHLAQVMVNGMPSGERYKKDLYFDYVYDKHGVTKAQIDSSLVYYARYPKELSLVYDNLSQRIALDIERIEREGQMVVSRKAMPVEGDSVDLWYDARFIQLLSSPLAGNTYDFSVPADSNFIAGDKIVWEGEVLFLHGKIDSLHKYVYLNLLVEYANDSVAVADTLLYVSGSYSLALQDSLKVKRVNGSAFMKDSSGKECVLLLTPSLMRYHMANLYSGELHEDEFFIANQPNVQSSNIPK